ncbi:hypothetical protein D3879_13860 [Pseudomonas cavernicola]|uniref:Pentapeptide MXKDX repeat protein n=1 Tax=Pseudomonas cavernicola TaxID=2320866 RepID=A0A418XP59_9PSED|nr:hypothetical protein [Pseudomonas cavernicola]RJG14238.1 hypothetical protein D3879_13860 [Pseudomonas cavernicola]
MRNSISHTAVLTALITLGAVSTGFAEQSKNTAQGSSDMMKGEDMQMMEGSKMPMMDMMQEMSSMMKNCNAMMENMNKHMGKEAPQGDSKMAQ